MNAFERMHNRLQGRPVDRVPNFNIFMTFAPHAIGLPLSRYYLDYRVLCAANMEMLNCYQVDLVQAISDPYREAVDFGLEVEFPIDGLPLRKQPLIQETGDLERLPAPDPGCGPRMSDRLEAIRCFRQQVGGEVPIMGWVEGALAEANDLRGDTALMLDLFDRPEWLEALLEKVVQVEIEFARQQVQAGADIVGLGDAIASLLSPDMYRRFALPYEQRIFAAVHELGALGRLHICGNTTRLLADMLESGADLIDIDWMVDFKLAAETFGDRAAPVGNFDPVSVMLRGTPEEVRAAVRYCLAAGGPRGFSAAGCEVPDGTPAENLHAQTAVLRESS